MGLPFCCSDWSWLAVVDVFVGFISYLDVLDDAVVSTDVVVLAGLSGRLSKGGTAGGFDGCLEGEGLGGRCLGYCRSSWFNGVLNVVGLTHDVVVLAVVLVVVVKVVRFLLVWASCYVIIKY
jgi:hypothetical protein